MSDIFYVKDYIPPDTDDGDKVLKKTRIIYTILFLVIFLTEIIIALFINDKFVRPYIGDTLVTVLICCFLKVLIPRPIKTLPIFVLLFAIIVEIGQYFDIIKLMRLDNISFLSIIFGRTFSVADIICYALGCIIFFIIDRIINSEE